MPQRQLMAVALLLLQTFFSIHLRAQTVLTPPGFGAAGHLSAESPGIITSRLSPKEMERWKAIERIVFAEDENHQSLLPTLRGMWEWVETSGHTVFIEIIRTNRTSTCTAGNFSIERFDLRGDRHVAVIKLNLTNIDQAYVGPGAARANGFVPFEGLNREERYAEVFGHELAHAIDILTTPESARKVEETVEQTNEMFLRGLPRRRNEFISAELKRRLTSRDVLLRELERRAEAMEYAVWRELTESKAYREKSQSLSARQ
jgi:hypothetical protein